MRVSQVDSDDVPAKAVHGGERLEITVLHRFFRLGAILEHAPCRAVEALIVAPRDQANGVRIALDDETAKLDVTRPFIIQRDLSHGGALQPSL